jgi:phosphoribosylglycinamide formyltransferase-1
MDAPHTPPWTPPDQTRRLGVLISGRGSNMQALLEAITAGRLEATLAVVVSNRADAAGLGIARDAGVETVVVEHRGWPDRAAYDARLAEVLEAHGVSLVCLAGFMRIVGPALLERFPQRVLNIHPSLLPAFPGLNAQQQAFDHGVRITGATVHIVDEGLDAGPIVAQAAVPVLDDDTPGSLAARILVEEHRLYPAAVATILAGGWRVEGRRFVVKRDGAAEAPR